VIYVVTGTYSRYIKILETLDSKGLSVKYVSGIHMLTKATSKDFYFVSGLVDDRKDYSDIMSKIKKIDMKLWNNND
jgi:hypothetical protein